MAKFKLAKGKKAKTSRPGGAVSCILLLVMGIVLVSLLFYAILRSA